MSQVDDALAGLKAIAQGKAPAASGPSASNALGGNYTNGKAPMVYWGEKSATHRGDGAESALDSLGIKKEIPLQSAVSDWYSWSEAERSAFGQRLYKLGLVRDPHDYGAVFQQWQGAVQEASNFYSFAGKKVTPWQVLDLVAGTANGGGHATTQTNTSKSFSIPTVEDAHGATKQLFQALMGRDPDEGELDRYASMMTAYAQKHPTITKQTQTTDIHGNTTSSTTSSGGYTAQGMQDLLGNQAKADPEYGSYQAATTYWNAMMRELGSGG